MKTSAIRKSTSSSAPTGDPQTDAQLQDDFDDLVMKASQGDRRAIGAIAVAMGPTLLKEARVVLGEYADEDWDVLQDFLVRLLEGWSYFKPVQGRAVVWMRRTVRAIAQTRRDKLERENGDEG